MVSIDRSVLLSPCIILILATMATLFRMARTSKAVVIAHLGQVASHPGFTVMELLVSSRELSRGREDL